jgi:hypothetical protein
MPARRRGVKEVEEVKEAGEAGGKKEKQMLLPQSEISMTPAVAWVTPRFLSPRPGRGWNEAHALCPRVYTLGYRLPPRRGCNKQMLLPQGGISMTAGSRIVIARTLPARR